jgi:hypothetical protein
VHGLHNALRGERSGASLTKVQTSYDLCYVIVRTPGDRVLV